MHTTIAITLTVLFICSFSYCKEKKPGSPAIQKEWTTYYSEDDGRKDSSNYTKLTGDTVNIDSFMIKLSVKDTLKWSTWFGE